jgi:predicted  nucleic acid-binding Zn-ribbon protein
MSLESTELKIGDTTASSLYSRLEAVEAQQIPDISPIRENLATLGTRLETLLSQQEKLLELNTDVSTLSNEIEAMKATVAKAEIIINDIGDTEVKFKALTKEVEDLWQGMDYLSNPLK